MAGMDAWNRDRWLRLWLFTCAQLANPGVFDLDDESLSSSYPLKRSLQRSDIKERPTDPDRILHGLYDHVRNHMSQYVAKETVEEAMGDLSSLTKGRWDVPEPVTEAWNDVGQDMRTAAERLSQDPFGTFR